MFFLKNPIWIYSNQYQYNNLDDIPEHVFKSVNQGLDMVQSDNPLVSIVITAWNEELNILNCISSLSNMETKIPFEIIVVNNNSQDDTQRILDKLHVRCYFQSIQGCGPSRQLGQERAKGKYILLADADCIYPPCWINAMIEKLQKEEVVCVYGRYSFFAEANYPRWKLYILERLKDIIAEVRHFKRPYLNAFGISMGYIKEYGLEIGFIDKNIRGNDGRLCFDLMKYGKVKQVRSNAARAWTKPRTLQNDGNFANALYKRVRIELGRLVSMLNTHPPHDTKISKN